MIYLGRTCSNKVLCKMNRIIGVLKRRGRSVNVDVRIRVYNAFIAPCLDYCLPVWSHLPKTSADHMEHCILKMLRCIKHNPNVSIKKPTFTELVIRAFQRTIVVCCCVRVFNARQQEILQNILYFYCNAASTYQTCSCSDGANKLRTFIPKRRADDYTAFRPLRPR